MRLKLGDMIQDQVFSFIFLFMKQRVFYVCQSRIYSQSLVVLYGQPINEDYKLLNLGLILMQTKQSRKSVLETS